MNSRLNQLEAEILIGCVNELADQQQRSPPSSYGYSSAKQAWRDAQEGLVRCNPGQWAECDLSDASQRVAVSRTYKGLERRGLVERFAEGGSVTTHLRPTLAGQKWVAENVKPEHAADG